MPSTLCVDIGSTFTKAALVDTATGELIATDAVPTTATTDVLEGVDAVRERLGAGSSDLLACSSAGGGLRLAVVGYERDVTAEAGHRVGLSAGARVVHIAAGEMSRDDLTALRRADPDLVLLVGGTDGGNADVLLHNAERLARARVRMPVVVAGNEDAAQEVSHLLASTGRRHVVTANVLPAIGVIRPEPAREAIRTVFLRHVIGGKGLSRGPRLAEIVRAATPDAVLDGVQVLADVVEQDVLVVDVGGATTDVYSVITPQGEDAVLAKEVVAPLWSARTVEADLGVRWNARGVVEAADREHVTVDDGTRAHAVRVGSHPSLVATAPSEWAADRQLALAAAVVAARRHGRPPQPGEDPRPLSDVALVVGSGGVLRHAPPPTAMDVLGALVHDHAGGWRTPRDARTVVDTAYVLFAVGLLRAEHSRAARALCRALVAGREG